MKRYFILVILFTIGCGLSNGKEKSERSICFYRSEICLGDSKSKVALNSLEILNYDKNSDYDQIFIDYHYRKFIDQFGSESSITRNSYLSYNEKEILIKVKVEYFSLEGMPLTSASYWDMFKDLIGEDQYSNYTFSSWPDLIRENEIIIYEPSNFRTSVCFKRVPIDIFTIEVELLNPEDLKMANDTFILDDIKN